MSRSWTNSPERTYPSRDIAIAWLAQLIAKREETRRTKGQYGMTMDEISLEAVERANRAKLDAIPSEGGEMDGFEERTIPDSGEAEHRPTKARRVARDTAGCVFPVRSASEAEYEIDRLISELESGEGAGE